MSASARRRWRGGGAKRHPPTSAVRQHLVGTSEAAAELQQQLPGSLPPKDKGALASEGATNSSQPATAGSKVQQPGEHPVTVVMPVSLAGLLLRHHPSEGVRWQVRVYPLRGDWSISSGQHLVIIVLLPFCDSLKLTRALHPCGEWPPEKSLQ
jgi:hypothetical protein